MKYLDQTWFPEQLAPEHRAELELLCANAERLSSTDLAKLAAMMTELHDIDQARAKEAAEQQAYEEEFRRARAREVNEALRNAENEKQIRRARIAAALGIDPTEVDLGD